MLILYNTETSFTGTGNDFAQLYRWRNVVRSLNFQLKPKVIYTHTLKSQVTEHHSSFFKIWFKTNWVFKNRTHNIKFLYLTSYAWHIVHTSQSWELRSLVLLSCRRSGQNYQNLHQTHKTPVLKEPEAPRKVLCGNNEIMVHSTVSRALSEMQGCLHACATLPSAATSLPSFHLCHSWLHHTQSLLQAVSISTCKSSFCAWTKFWSFNKINWGRGTRMVCQLAVAWWSVFEQMSLTLIP